MKIRIRLVKILLVTAMIVVTGCAYMSIIKAPEVVPGSSLKINQSFYALPNGSHVYFQNGAHLPVGQLDTWSNYCVLYVYNDQHEADYITSVQPGYFPVIYTKNGREVVEYKAKPIGTATLMASLEWQGIDLPSYILYRTDMRLNSIEQPDVRFLSCYQKASIYGDYFPKLGEMRQALGEVIQIITPDS